MLKRFRLSTLFWMTLAVALACGWHLDLRRHYALRHQLESSVSYWRNYSLSVDALRQNNLRLHEAEKNTIISKNTRHWRYFQHVMRTIHREHDIPTDQIDGLEEWEKEYLKLHPRGH